MPLRCCSIRARKSRCSGWPTIRSAPSQALDVAREHGLPESVLRRAEQYLLLDGQDMTAVMDRLNALAAKREGELDALKAEQQRTREKRKAVQERFERERERLIKDVRELSAKVMKDWQEGKAGHKQALKELAKVRAELHVSPEQEEAAAPAFDIAELKPGQHVMHRPWNKKAVVREVDARQNRVKLDMNGVTLWADARVARPSRCAAAAGQAEVRRAGAGRPPEAIPKYRSFGWICAASGRIRLSANSRSTSTGRCCPGARVWKSFTVAVRGPFARKCTRS